MVHLRVEKYAFISFKRIQHWGCQITVLSNSFQVEKRVFKSTLLKPRLGETRLANVYLQTNQSILKTLVFQTLGLTNGICCLVCFDAILSFIIQRTISGHSIKSTRFFLNSTITGVQSTTIWV